jgi:hypothetical protein
MKRGEEGHQFLVSFDENSFGDISLFPEIRRRPRSGRGRKGLSGGKLVIRQDGLRWRAGSIATPRCEISGHFFLPWSVIASVDVSDIPHSIDALGGAVTVFFTGDRGKLYGEFLGSRTKLLAALASTPLGENADVAEKANGAQEAPTMAATSTPPFGQLSENGEQFWNGTEWVSAASSDGQMFWTGDHWSRHA